MLLRGVTPIPAADTPHTPASREYQQSSAAAAPSEWASPAGRKQGWRKAGARREQGGSKSEARRARREQGGRKAEARRKQRRKQGGRGEGGGDGAAAGVSEGG